MFFLIFFIICLISTILTFVYFKLHPKKNINKLNKFNFVGRYGQAETLINISFGIISLIDNDKIKKYPCKSARNNIEKGARILITEYSIDEELFIVDNYPII